jgi:hypothetical protein
MTTEIRRGTHFLTLPQRKAWQQALAISREHGSTEGEARALMVRATRLALEQFARKAGES